MRLRLFTVFPLLLISALLSSAAPVGFEPMPPPADAVFSPWLCTAALASPCEKATLSSFFGYRLSPFDGTLQFHCGVDLAAKKGSDIYAVLGGKVIAARYHNSYGNYILIDHHNGFVSCYAHCDKLLKKEGAHVKTGQKIAKVGDSGDTTGSHLHFEIRQNGVFLDPLWVLGDGNVLCCFSEEA